MYQQQNLHQTMTLKSSIVLVQKHSLLLSQASNLLSDLVFCYSVRISDEVSVSLYISFYIHNFPVSVHEPSYHISKNETLIQWWKVWIEWWYHEIKTLSD